MQFSGWFVRAGAYLVDSLVAAPFFLAAGLLPDGNTPAFVALATLGFVVWGVNRWWLAGRTGQSLGRKLLGIRLVSAGTGRPIGPVKAAARDLAHVLDGAIFYIGYLFPFWTAKRQTLADMVTRTVVAR
ncbi:RDD family protein [Micromonospora sp. SH-82]|uniref:RDD family protein n=1 Tax=Micromonospora sp. SH-82 TaxID=3132938 RepID=UPI003EB7CD82